MLQMITQIGSYLLTVPSSKDTIFTPAPLAGYPFFKRLQIRVADIAFYFAITLIGGTVRFETDGMQHFDSVESLGKQPIYAFWHDRIFLSTYYFRDRGIVVMTSQSFDGEYIARFIQRFGYGAIRGSSSRGGARALIEMIRTMRDWHPMGFTVDGPRGPRYVAKIGPVALAKRTGNPIVPFIVECQKRWTVGSWDRLQIPRPFTRAAILVGEPIFVDKEANDDEALSILQTALDDLVARGEEWRAS